MSNLKRSLFPCKSSRHANQENYVMFSYGEASETITPSDAHASQLELDSFHSPVTSTMLADASNELFSTPTNLLDPPPFILAPDHLDVSLSPRDNLTYEVIISGVNQLGDTTTSTRFGEPISREIFRGAEEEMEIVRNRDDFERSATGNVLNSNNDYEDVTIIKHNNSPVSSYANDQLDEVKVFPLVKMKISFNYID